MCVASFFLLNHPTHLNGTLLDEKKTKTTLNSTTVKKNTSVVAIKEKLKRKKKVSERSSARNNWSEFCHATCRTIQNAT